MNGKLKSLIGAARESVWRGSGVKGRIEPEAGARSATELQFPTGCEGERERDPFNPGVQVEGAGGGHFRAFTLRQPYSIHPPAPRLDV